MTFIKRLPVPLSSSLSSLLPVLLAFLLLGGASTFVPVSGAVFAATNADVDTDTPKELIFWNFWNPKFIEPVIKKFEAENPGVKIRNEQLNWGNGLDKIVVSLANKMAPDICELGSTWTGKFMAKESLCDLTDALKDDAPNYLMWEPATWNGRIYGMPWLVGTRVMFYNRTLFRQAGLDPDQCPETWDELLHAAQRIHNPAAGVYGFGINAGEGHILYKKFLPFVWGNDGHILDQSGEKLMFDSPQTRQAMTFYRKLLEFGFKEKQDILDDAFKRGSLGLAISGSWNFASFPKEAPDLDFGVGLMPRPAADNGHSSSFLGGEILVLFKNCRHPQEALKFIRFLTRPENTLPITKEALVSFPAHKEAFNDAFFQDDQRLQIFVKQMETSVHPPIHPLWIELESIINDCVEKILYGGDIDTGLSQASAEYQRVLRQAQERQASRSELAANNDAQVPAAHQPNHLGYEPASGWQLFLLGLIAAGTLVNAVLLMFLLRETKKK